MARALGSYKKAIVALATIMAVFVPALSTIGRRNAENHVQISLDGLCFRGNVCVMPVLGLRREGFMTVPFLLVIYVLFRLCRVRGRIIRKIRELLATRSASIHR